MTHAVSDLEHQKSAHQGRSFMKMNLATAVGKRLMRFLGSWNPAFQQFKIGVVLLRKPTSNPKHLPHIAKSRGDNWSAFLRNGFNYRRASGSASISTSWQLGSYRKDVRAKPPRQIWNLQMHRIFVTSSRRRLAWLPKPFHFKLPPSKCRVQTIMSRSNNSFLLAGSIGVL